MLQLPTALMLLRVRADVVATLAVDVVVDALEVAVEDVVVVYVHHPSSPHNVSDLHPTAWRRS